MLAGFHPKTLGSRVSESYKIEATDSSFSSHFAPLQPQQQQQQPTGDEKSLYAQQQYLNKLYICHKAIPEKSENVQSCPYATIYDEKYKIPLISVKKYTSIPNPWKTAEREEWTFNGNLNNTGAKRSVVFPTDSCRTTFYAENERQTPTQGEIHRGHLLANTLGVGDEEAKATFSLYNVVPQFSHTNTGHWRSSVERLAKREITNCLSGKKAVQDAVFYLVAGTHNYTTLNYSCENCQGKSVWNFDGRPEADRHKTREKCCKVTPESSSLALAFPKTMSMAGCCSYKRINTTRGTGVDTVHPEPDVKTFYGWSSNLNKTQREKNDQDGVSFRNGVSFQEGHSLLSRIDGKLDPFKYTICGGQAPQGYLKRQKPDSNNDNLTPMAKCTKTISEDLERLNISGPGRKKRSGSVLILWTVPNWAHCSE